MFYCNVEHSGTSGEKKMFTTAVVISSGHLGQTSDKPAIVVIVREIGQLYLQKGR